MGKKRSLWKKPEEPETPPVEAPVEKKTSKEYYTQQKEEFLADERLSAMDDERKKAALGKFFDLYGAPYISELGVSDKDQVGRLRERFVDENISNIAEPKKKEDTPTYEPPEWLGEASGEEHFPKADITQPEITPDTVAKDEAARKAMGLATGIPAIIKAPPPDTPTEKTEAVAKDPKTITPQGPNDTSVTSIVKSNVENIYAEKGWPSPMGKIQEFYDGVAELQRGFQLGGPLGDFKSSGLSEEEYNKKVGAHNQKVEEYKVGIDELAQEIGLGRKENGDLFIFPNELAMYKGEMEKAYRKHLDETGTKEKDGFMKDFFQALSTGSEDVLNTGTRILATTEGLSNKLLGLLDSDRKGPTYWKDRAALETEIVDKHRADNKRYDESITELLAQGKNGKAAAQTALSAAEALPRLAVLAMGNAAGVTNITLGWMGGDKAIQEYMRTEKVPDMTEFTRVINALGKGISEPMFESMGTLKLLNAGRRAIKEMGNDVVRKEMMKAYTPFFQRQMAIWDKGVSAMTREAAEEGATAATDDMMDVMSGVKTFDQFGETILDEMIVGGVIGFGLGSPQMIAESGGKSKYVKNIAKTIPEDFDIETKLAMASMIVKYDQLRWQMNEAPEAMKEGYKAQMTHTQDLINDMMDRGTFEPTEVAPNIQTFVEKVKDGTLPDERMQVADDIKKAGDILAKEKERPSPELVVEESKEGKFTVKQEGETGMTKEFESREEAEKFVDNFKMLTQGERTFEEQKKITEEKVVAGEAKKPEPKKEDIEAEREIQEGEDIVNSAIEESFPEEHRGAVQKFFGLSPKGEYRSSIPMDEVIPIATPERTKQLLIDIGGIEMAKRYKEGTEEYDEAVDNITRAVDDYMAKALKAQEEGTEIEAPKAVSDVMQKVFSIQEKYTEAAKKEEPIEEPKPEKAPEKKELTEQQVSHNNLVSKVRAYNAIPAKNTVQRAKAMGPITQAAQTIGYGITTEKGKLIALNEKGKRIKTISLPPEYTSIKESKNPKFQKFANEFLEDENMIIGLGIQLYGKKLTKARKDAMEGKKNQDSDLLIRELERMYEEGHIEVRIADTTKKIPIEDIETLIAEPALAKFIEEHGIIDATNIDQALEAGLINQEDYETTKQQLEDELTQRAEIEAEPGIEEDDLGTQDIEGQEPEVKKPELSEKMRSLAENIRKAKMETDGVMMGTLPGLPQAVNFSIEVVATAIEGGAAVVDAVNTGIAKLKEQEFFKKLSTEAQKKMEEDVRAKLNEIAGIQEETEAAAMSIEDSEITMDKPGEKVTPREKTEPVEKGSPQEKLINRLEARRKEINRLNAKKQGKVSKVIDEHFVDVNEPFKKAIKKEGGEQAQKFINRMNLEAGAPARAKLLIQEAQKKIFGKGLRTMSKNQQELLSEVVDLVRTRELANLYKKQGKAPSKHEGDITGDEATVLLKDFQDKAPWIFEAYGIKDYDPGKIMKSINAYHNVMRSQLTKMYENGIIGENAYNKLKDEQPYYSPRKYISHMDEIDPNGTMSGIKPLQGGSVGEKVVDINTLLSDVVARTEGLVARNNKMQASAAYATETESSIIRKAPFSEVFQEKLDQREQMQEEGVLFEGMPMELPYMDPEFAETPKGMTPVDYFDNGNRHRVWIDTELYEYFDYAPADERTEMALHGLSMMLGTPILKFFATGANPEFAIKNLPIDALHAWMTTEEYSGFMPAALAQMSKDYATVTKDAWKKTGRYREYINEGGGMDFLATQGTEILSRYKRYTKWTSSVGIMRDGMAKIGEFSETLTRLALRERYINNRVSKAEKEGKTLSEAEMKSIKEDGTAFARNYLDFSQGGKTAKLLDKFIPYFNAGVQVTRGSLRAAANNPKLFATKLSQIAGLALTLTAWNMGDWGDDEKAEERRKAYLNDVNDQVKARNFILMTNMKRIDNAGRVRQRYFKIPKDALQSNLTSLIEDIYIKATHDGEYKIMDDKMFAAMNNEFRNITDLGNMPPLIRAAQGYKQNYDSFYEDEIWSGRDQPDKDASSEYYQGVTPPRYVKFGHLTKMSPIRTQYFAKQFFTEGNLYGSILGEFFDGLSTGFNGEFDTYLNESWGDFKNAPVGLRRIMKETYPKELEIAEDAEKELNKVKTDNDIRFNKLIGKKSVGDVDDKAIQQFLMDTYERDGLYEVDRMRDKFSIKAKTEGVSPAVIKLKWWSPEVRALGFYEMLKQNPRTADKLWEQAEAAGIRSKRFNQEVGRLITMDQQAKEKE